MPKPNNSVMHCVVVKLQTTSDEQALLDDFRMAFREVYNQYITYGQQLQTANYRILEKKPVTHRLIENTRQCARDVACESIRSYYELRKENDKAEFPKVSSLPMTARMNYRDGYVITKDLQVGISIKKGLRIKVPFIGSSEQLLKIQQTIQGTYRFGEAVLKKYRQEYYLHINIELAKKPIFAQQTNQTFIGIDVNEKNIALSALTPTGKLLGSVILSFTDINTIKQTFFTTRKRLQMVNKLSIVKTNRYREHNIVIDIYHKVTNMAIQWIEKFPNPVIILEDLTSIRNNIQMGKKMNKRLHSWAFNELQRQLTYKAYYRNWFVQQINPEFTSQTCPVCTKARKSNKHKRRFQCKTPNCNFTDHRDRVASVNIALVGIALLYNLSTVLTLKKYHFGSHSIKVVRQLASGLVKRAKECLTEWQDFLATLTVKWYQTP